MNLVSILIGLIFNHKTDVHTPELEANAQYNIVHNLAGSGPYVQYPGYGISPNLPPDCDLQQVYMIARHGERFPTRNAGQRFEQTTTKLQNQQLNGSLSFFNTYEYFVKDKSNYDQEVTEVNSDSAFSGSLSSYRNGNWFRKRYDRLYNPTDVLPVFTSNSKRCYDTSVNFVAGFMGKHISPVKYNIIDENGKMGANSLTPRYGCPSFEQTAQEYNITYHLDTFLQRLKKENPNLQLNFQDVENLFEMCAYELNVKGKSPICTLPRPNELLVHEYKQDLKLYHEIGYGNNMSQVVGSPLLKALVELFTSNDPNSSKIWINFTHDHDIITFYTALGLFNDTLTRSIKFDTQFKKSLIIPQSTRLIIELFTYENQPYIRVILNESVIPLKCHYGPGFSCKLAWLQSRPSLKIDYNRQCATAGPNSVKFYWNYNKVLYNASLIS